MGKPRAAYGRALTWGAARATDLLATPIRTRIDELRAAYCLAPMDCSVNEFCGRLPLYLVGSVPELDYSRRDLPPNVRYVGPLTWHPPQPPGTTEWLDQIPSGAPWVHVTEGTSHHQQSFLLRAAALGLANANVEVIATTVREDQAAKPAPALAPAPAAANVHLARWLSHSMLLPRCDVVVTTGGAGTIISALRAGVPLVVVPTGWDKPANAKRVVDAGAGVWLSPRRCTPERLREAVESVLAEPRYRQAAARISERLAAAPGPAGAAELIGTLARRETRATAPAIHGGGK
jgi:UDP:flavonoid glycosyltransferase YjiC (YdhE family)